MRVGEIVLAHHIKAILGQDERGKPTVQADYRGSDGKDFVFVFLGMAERDGEVFKVEEALNALGWFRRKSNRTKPLSSEKQP